MRHNAGKHADINHEPKKTKSRSKPTRKFHNCSHPADVICNAAQNNFPLNLQTIITAQMPSTGVWRKDRKRNWITGGLMF